MEKGKMSRKFGSDAMGTRGCQWGRSKMTRNLSKGAVNGDVAN